MYKPRSYRQWIKNDDLVWFEVVEKETDLAISATKNLEDMARATVLTYRSDIERYISRDAAFLSSLEPVDLMPDAPDIVRAMAEAGRTAGVGPMAAVAGAMAEYVGRALLSFSGEVIVENGGDIFVKSDKERIFGIFAGEDSPFTGKLALKFSGRKESFGVCTSSGTVSHSLSFGKPDAIVIVARTATLADAVATAAGNRLTNAGRIEEAIECARAIEGVTGVVAIIGERVGSWGDIVFV